MTQSSATSNPRILCVDDDSALLELLAHHLRGDYEVATALSGDAALELLSQGLSPAVIVADMKMPRIDGATLLAQVSKDAPAVVRVMLTGETDQAVAVQAINTGQIFRFLVKGCSRQELRRAIADSVEQHRLLAAEKTLLEDTLVGAIRALMDALAVVNPVAFGRAQRIRKLALELARRAGLAPSWSLEAASLLSQLGYLAVPQEVLERQLSGDRVSINERRQLDRVPAIACDLVRRVPRLEPVIEIIKGLDTAFGPDHSKPVAAIDILRIAADYDRYLVHSAGPQAALDALRANSARYPTTLLGMLAAHVGAEIQTSTIREIPLNRVSVGMVLVGDVRTETGALLVPAQFEVTSSFLERLQNFPAGVGDRLVRVHV
jgi:CheY-like chemotaxis protein